MGKEVTVVVDDTNTGVSTCMASSEGMIDDCAAERLC